MFPWLDGSRQRAAVPESPHGRSRPLGRSRARRPGSHRSPATSEPDYGAWPAGRTVRGPPRRAGRRFRLWPRPGGRPGTDGGAHQLRAGRDISIRTARRQPQPAGRTEAGPGVRDGDAGGRGGAGTDRSSTTRSTTVPWSTAGPRSSPRGESAGLRIISDHVAPGQWEYARSPSAKELAATTVFDSDPDQCSVKVSRGPPDDGDGPDAGLEVWAGEIPLRMVRLDPVADPALRPGIAVPDHLQGWVGPAPRHPSAWRALQWRAGRSRRASRLRRGQLRKEASGAALQPVGFGDRLVVTPTLHHVDPLGQRRVAPAAPRQPRSASSRV